LSTIYLLAFIGARTPLKAAWLTQKDKEKERKEKKRKRLVNHANFDLDAWVVTSGVANFLILRMGMKLQPLGNCHVEPVVGDFDTSPRKPSSNKRALTIVRRDFWAQLVEIRVFSSPTDGYMLILFHFSFVMLRYIM
jgi:hypothetical protein